METSGVKGGDWNEKPSWSNSCSERSKCSSSGPTEIEKSVSTGGATGLQTGRRALLWNGCFALKNDDSPRWWRRIVDSWSPGSAFKSQSERSVKRSSRVVPPPPALRLPEWSPAGPWATSSEIPGKKADNMFSSTEARTRRGWDGVKHRRWRKCKWTKKRPAGWFTMWWVCVTSASLYRGDPSLPAAAIHLCWKETMTTAATTFDSDTEARSGPLSPASHTLPESFPGPKKQ